MKTFNFNFNTQYAADLRNAVNDRVKQSIDTVHSGKGTHGDYYAWNRICAAMDRLEDTLSYLNTLTLGHRGNYRAAFDFYDFINNAYIAIDCIRTLGTIFRVSSNIIEDVEQSSNVFGKKLGFNCTDSKYFEYIRSLCAVHPLFTNRQPELLDGSTFHCCPTVTWDIFPGYDEINDADLMAIIYSAEKNKKTKYLGLYVSEFEEYLTKWIEIIPKIIEAKNNYTDKEYERLRTERVKTLEDFSGDAIEYLKYLKDVYCNRFDYGSDYLFDQFIKVLALKPTDKRNNQYLSCYQQAIIYSLEFLRNELQNMSIEGYENTGIKYPDPAVETTLFDELGCINTYDSAFSKYGYQIGKIYYLEEDNYSTFDKHYARRLLEETKSCINQYVHFSNKESDEETVVLVHVAKYVEALERKSLLNKNIPNDVKYRIQILSKEQLDELLSNDCVENNKGWSLDDLEVYSNEYGG